MGLGALGAVAAMGVAAIAQSADYRDPVENAAPAPRALAAAAAAVALALAEEPAFDDNAEVEIPLSSLALWRSASRPHGAPDFDIGGFGVSFAAFKPKLKTDAFGPAGLRSDSRAMGKAMPGYPQPARLVVGVKVSF